MDFRRPAVLVCMMIQGRCDVTLRIVTRELSCRVTLDINSFTESCVGDRRNPITTEGAGSVCQCVHKAF